MALTTVEEAQTRQLIAQEAALLSLASNEPTITSKLGATKVNLSQLPAATTPADADIYLVRQGTTDKSVAGSVFKAYVRPDAATDTTAGVVALAIAANYPSASDVEAATPAYLNSAIAAIPITSKIQPLRTPTLASNALTIGVNPTVLDFRSTLTSATINTRTLSAAVSLTIPSGASLGAINAVQADFIIGLMDNSGILEPFVTNLSGGMDLTEMGLISTTAISAAATSASVAYSATARTNLPYRIIGVYRNTQATAGTYVTAPSLVQGVGGQALRAMAGIGFGQTWQLLTGSRVSGTTYFNTTGRPIAVIALASAANIAAVVNGVTLTSNTAGLSPHTIIIPAGASYSLTSSTGAFASWAELR